MVSIQRNIRVNERILSREVRVIGPNSEQIGVVVLRRALELAKESNLDLVEVAPTGKPPVCRIMDYSKYKYDQEKKERRVKRHQRIAHLKQIRLKPHIDDHDYQIKLKQITAFLNKKDKVKVNLFFRGRELAFKEQGRRLLTRVVADIAPHGDPDKPVALEGRVMTVVLIPKAGKTNIPPPAPSTEPQPQQQPV